MEEPEPKTNQKDIKDTESLLSYLQNPAEGFRSAYHYTSLEALYQICSNKTLRFSRMKKMNDEFEQVLFCTNRDFFFCLSKGVDEEKDNFGLWAMYGKLNVKKSNKAEDIGVKIYFPSSTIKQIRIENKSLIQHHIAYTDLIDNYDKPTNREIYVGSHSTEINDFDKDKCSGFIKDVAWRYENEMRLRIAGDSERITDKTKDIPISDEILSSLKVYPSPLYTLDEVEKAFKERCGGTEIHVNFCENKYRDSLRLKDKN